MTSQQRFPASLILFGLITVIASAGFVRLGLWQLDRHQEVRRDSETKASLIAREPIRLDASSVYDLDVDSLLWRRVEFSGQWDFEREVVIRSRARSGTPGIHVVTPLLLNMQSRDVDRDRAVVLVLRGWLPSPNPATAELAATHTAATVSSASPRLALVRASRAGHGGPMIILGGDSTVRSYAAIDVELIAGDERKVLPFFLQLLPDDGRTTERSERPYPIPLPALGNGPHLLYMIQWFAFALITTVGSIAFVRRETRRRAYQEKRH